MSFYSPIPDYYSVLGVSRNATIVEIKKAYRNLCRMYHPDLHPNKDSEEKMKEVNSAYMVIGDEAKRKEYDELWSMHINQETRQTTDGSGAGQRTYSERQQGMRSARSTQPQNSGDYLRNNGFGGSYDPLSNLFSTDNPYWSNFTSGFTGYGGQQSQQRQQTLEQNLYIPPSDIGLLAGLVQAYLSKHDGTFYVKQVDSVLDQESPPVLYVLIRQGTKVIISRALHDWKAKSIIDNDLITVRTAEGQTHKIGANTPVAERFLYGIDGNVVQGVPVPTGLREYHGALKSLARQIAARLRDGTKLPVAEIQTDLKQLKRYVKANHFLYPIADSLFDFKMHTGERVHPLPLNTLNQVIQTGEQLLIQQEGTIAKHFSFDLQRPKMLLLPESDWGLLAGLVVAYRSKQDGCWTVPTADADRQERPFLSTNMYRVQRTGQLVKIFRAINDWRPANERTQPLQVSSIWDEEKKTTLHPSTPVAEQYLTHYRGFIDSQVHVPPYQTEYLTALHSLAEHIAQAYTLGSLVYDVIERDVARINACGLQAHLQYLREGANGMSSGAVRGVEVSRMLEELRLREGTLLFEDKIRLVENQRSTLREGATSQPARETTRYGRR